MCIQYINKKAIALDDFLRVEYLLILLKIYYAVGLFEILCLPTRFACLVGSLSDACLRALRLSCSQLFKCLPTRFACLASNKTFNRFYYFQAVA